MYNSIKQNLCKEIFQKICFFEIYYFSFCGLSSETRPQLLFVLIGRKQCRQPDADGLDDDSCQKDHSDIQQDKKMMEIILVSRSIKRQFHKAGMESDLNAVVFPPCLNILFHGCLEFLHRGKLHLWTTVSEELHSGSLAVDISLKIIEEGLHSHSLLV